MGRRQTKRDLAGAAQFLPESAKLVVLPGGKLQYILIIGCHERSCVAVIYTRYSFLYIYIYIMFSGCRERAALFIAL